MAAFGCTTDRNLGNGDPVVTPGLRTTPIGGNSSGSETPSANPPMMSSYSGAALPSVRARVAPQTTAAEAAAIMAEQQPRVRVLGPASPDSGGRGYYSDRLNYGTQQVSAAGSINSTIYNPNPTGGAITSGAGDVVGSDVAATSFLDTTGTGTVTNASGAATILPTTAGAVTPTGAAIAVPSGFAAVGTLSPTAAAVVNPPASISSSSTLAAVSSQRTAGGTLTTPTATTPTANTSINATATTSTVNPIRVVNTNGRVVITNTGTSGRQQ